MENQLTSPLQQQFPLSPKKFWKKIIGSLIGCGLIAIVLFVMAALIQASGFWEMFSGVFVLLVIYLCLRALYIKIYIRLYFYSASDDFVTIKKGVFAPAEIHVQYPKIQDVYVDQDIIDRIMGLYDVHIASATITSTIEAHIDGVEKVAADGLKNFLLDKIRGGGSNNQAPMAPGVAPATPSSNTTAPAAKPLDPSQMISSEQYPISSKWMSLQVVAALFHGFWLSALVTLYVGGQGTTFSFNWIIYIIVFVVIALCQIIYNAIWRNNFHFAFLPDYIQFSTQVLTKSEQHMPYRTVQDVIVKQGIIERLFGLTTVSIQNAAAGQSVRRSGWDGRAGGPQAVNIPGQTAEGANKIAEIVRSISLTRNSVGTGL